MATKEKEMLEEIREALSDISTTVHVGQNDSLLTAYTKAIEKLTNCEIVIRQVIDKIG
jgi:hypothetical protein